MAPTIRLRPMAPDDRHAVRDLVLAGLAERWGTATDPALNRDLDDVALAHPGSTTLVAVTDDGVVVGTGTIVPRPGATAEIVRMSVEWSRRGAGVGRMIVDALVEIAAAGHPPVRRIVLGTTATWHDAIRFYERCGFVITHHADGAFGRDAWFERQLDAAS
ncbi:MAG: GNAT family N-acetyltransferase [Actinobacteria bacterium]|nr:GNAT family N-acetyltransferase [Actinomycetota bacterium]